MLVGSPLITSNLSISSVKLGFTSIFCFPFSKKMGNFVTLRSFASWLFEKTWPNTIVSLKEAVRALNSGGIFYLSVKYTTLGRSL
jgi:hypothetical protein